MSLYPWLIILGAAFSWGLLTYGASGNLTLAFTAAFASITTLCAIAVIAREANR